MDEITQQGKEMTKGKIDILRTCIRFTQLEGWYLETEKKYNRKRVRKDDRITAAVKLAITEKRHIERFIRRYILFLTRKKLKYAVTDSNIT